MSKQEKNFRLSGYAVFIGAAIFVMCMVAVDTTDRYDPSTHNHSNASDYYGNGLDEPQVPKNSDSRKFSAESKGASASIFNPRTNSVLKSFFSEQNFSVGTNLSFMWWEFDKNPWDHEFVITEHEVQVEHLQNQHGVYTQTRLGTTPVVFLVRYDMLNTLKDEQIVATSDGNTYIATTTRLLNRIRNYDDFSIISPSPFHSGTGMAFAETIVAAKVGSIEFSKDDVVSNSVLIAEMLTDSVQRGLLEADVFKGVISGDISVGVLPESYILEQALAGSLGDYSNLTIVYPNLPVWLDFQLNVMSTNVKDADRNRLWDLTSNFDNISWDQLGIRQPFDTVEIVSPIMQQLGVMKEPPTSRYWTGWGVNDYLLRILEEVRN